VKLQEEKHTFFPHRSIEPGTQKYFQNLPQKKIAM
jgi:hypothetical protein